MYQYTYPANIDKYLKTIEKNYTKAERYTKIHTDTTIQKQTNIQQ